MRRDKRFVTVTDGIDWEFIFKRRNTMPILLCPNSLFNHNLHSGAWMRYAKRRNEDILLFVAGYPGADNKENRNAGWPLLETCTSRFKDQTTLVTEVNKARATPGARLIYYDQQV